MSKITYAPVPEAYKLPCSKPGKVVRLDYTCARYGAKYAFVYLPNGYDAADTATRYDILYLMHGGGEFAEGFFGTDENPTALRFILDNMIANGDMRPMLVVTPTFYPRKENDRAVSAAAEYTAEFHNELLGDLMPAVEGAYKTFAPTADPDGFRASREHRAFGGFSMGSVTTWYCFINCMDYFYTYLPMSGDCWVYGRLGGNAYAAETAAYLADALQKSGHKPDDFRIYAATGDKDIAYPQLDTQLKAMFKLTGVFTHGDVDVPGNVYYNMAPGGVHDYRYIFDYIYDALPFLYPAK